MAEALDLRGTDHFYQFRLSEGNRPRFWPRWSVMDRPYMVLATYDGSWDITTYPGTTSYTVADTQAATHVWRSGCVYTFEDTNGLLAALTAAGYDTVFEGAYIATYTEDYASFGLACS